MVTQADSIWAGRAKRLLLTLRKEEWKLAHTKLNSVINIPGTTEC